MKRQGLVTPLNLHVLVVVLLAALDLVLCVRLFVAWNTLHEAGPGQIQQDQMTARALDLQTRPLRGLPQKVEVSRTQEQHFYDNRFPMAYSEISSELGGLAAKNNVRLARIAYSQSPALPGLAEVRMDASLSGEYAPIMHLINGLERDKMFFLINGLTLTGQQGGMVNVRLRLTTYLHAADVDRLAPPTTPAEDQEVTP